MKTIRLKMDEELCRRLDAICDGAGCSRDEVVALLLKYAIEGKSLPSAFADGGNTLFPETDVPGVLSEGAKVRALLEREATSAHAREVARIYERS